MYRYILITQSMHVGILFWGKSDLSNMYTGCACFALGTRIRVYKSGPVL